MNTFLKNTAILAVGLLSVLSSCSGDFLDNKPTDAVDSGIVPVPSNAGRHDGGRCGVASDVWFQFILPV